MVAREVLLLSAVVTEAVWWLGGFTAVCCGDRGCMVAREVLLLSAVVTEAVWWLRRFYCCLLW